MYGRYFLLSIHQMEMLIFLYSSVAKKRSLFDDRPQEIQELTYIIREDITNLNKQIAQLQDFTRKQQSNQQQLQQNTKSHSSNIVVALQSKLATICLLYTSPSPRDRTRSRMPSSA